MCHSKPMKATVPTTSSIAYVLTVILVCRLQVRGLASSRRSSKSTGKPSAPSTTATATGRQIQRVGRVPDQVVLVEREAGVVERHHRVEDALVRGPPERQVVAEPQPQEEHDGEDALDVKLVSATPRTTRRMSPRPSVRVSAAARIRVRSPSRRAAPSPSSEAEVMKPSPPNWTPAMISTSPEPGPVRSACPPRPARSRRSPRWR